MFASLTRNSSNPKTGPIAVSTSSRCSCAPGCALAGAGGCYAEAGYFTRLHWDRVTAGKAGLPWESFLIELCKLPKGHRFRHNVAGDLPHANGRIDSTAALALADCCRHLTAWLYTHHDRTMANLATLRAMVRRGISVNLSFESLKEAARFHRKGYRAVAVVSPETEAGTYHGVRLVICPAMQFETVTCASCGGAGGPLCARMQRDFVIGFPAHGMRAKAAADRCSA